MALIVPARCVPDYSPGRRLAVAHKLGGCAPGAGDPKSRRLPSGPVVESLVEGLLGQARDEGPLALRGPTHENTIDLPGQPRRRRGRAGDRARSTCHTALAAPCPRLDRGLREHVVAYRGF